MALAIASTRPDPEQVLDAAQQRVVVVGRRVLLPGGDATTDDDAARPPTAGAFVKRSSTSKLGTGSGAFGSAAFGLALGVFGVAGASGAAAERSA